MINPKEGTSIVQIPEGSVMLNTVPKRMLTTSVDTTEMSRLIRWYLTFPIRSFPANRVLNKNTRVLSRAGSPRT